MCVHMRVPRGRMRVRKETGLPADDFECVQRFQYRERSETQPFGGWENEIREGLKCQGWFIGKGAWQRLIRGREIVWTRGRESREEARGEGGSG